MLPTQKQVMVLSNCNDQYQNDQWQCRYFGLMVKSMLIDDYMRLMDGVVIIIDKGAITHETIKRIHTIVKNNSDLPIAIVYNQLSGGETAIDRIIKLYKNTRTFSDTGKFLEWFGAKLQVRRVKPDYQYTSRTIPNDLLERTFEIGTLPLEIWDDHGKRRIIGRCIEKYGYEEAVAPDGWLCKHWRSYENGIGYGDKWDYEVVRGMVEGVNLCNGSF